MVSKLFLQRFLPFNTLTEELLAEASQYISIIEAQRGGLVFKRGKALKVKYYLLNGAVDLVDNRFCATKIESGQEGSEKSLNESERSEYSGRVASETATLFTIDRDVLAGFIQRAEVERTLSDKKSDSDPEWMSNLLNCPLFGLVPTSHIQLLFAKFQTRNVEAGETIVREGEFGKHFFVIAGGFAKVHSRTSGALGRLISGQYFGEESLVAKAARNASVTMETDGVLKYIDEETFNEVLKKPVLRYIRDDGLDAINKPYQLVDVRLPIEYRIEHVPGSKNIPLPKLRRELPQLSSNHAYVVLADEGGRSDIAAHLMTQAGFDTFILAQRGAEAV